MSQRKFKIFSIVSVVLLALVVLLNLSATFSWLADRKQLRTQSIEYGQIKLNANNEIGTGGYFASSTLENVNSGDYVLNNDVTFSLAENSEPAYIRAKYKVKSQKGKNLFDPSQWKTATTQNGLTIQYLEDEDCFVINGTNSSGNRAYAEKYFTTPIPLKIGSKYTVSTTYLSGTVDRTNCTTTAKDAVAYFGNSDTLGTFENWVCTQLQNENTSLVTAYTNTQAYSTKFWFWIHSGISFDNYKVRIQLEEGTSATGYQKFQGTTAENDLESYLKYGNMVIGENLLDPEVYTNKENYQRVVYDKLPLNLKPGTTYSIWASEVNIPASGTSTGGTYLITNDLNYNGATMKDGYSYITLGHSSASYWNLQANTPKTFTTSTTNTDYYLALYSSKDENGYSTHISQLTSIFKNLTLVEGEIDYYWSDKIGDYYYLMDAKTGEPLEVSDSSKTYTFLTKENSKINLNYFSNNTISGTNVTLSIGLEAIQVANLTASDVAKTTLENIQEKLDEINHVSNSGTHSVTFVIDGTKYAVSGISYGKNATLPTEVVSKINESDFAGFALSKNGYPVITKQSRGHSWIDLSSSTINNITENLILYATNESDLISEFDVVFKNGTTTLQTGKATNGKAAYLGETPTKASSSTVDYIFAGWKISGDSAGTVYSNLSDVQISQNTTFEASFVEKARTYEITYVLNGGAFKQSKLTSVSFTYTYGTSQNLPTSECMFKLNYTFAGWFENEDLSGSAITAISATQTGNKTYYAKWTDVSSTLTLNLNGGGYNGNTTAVTKKGTAGTTTIVENPTRDEYIFAGWYTSSNFDYLKYGTLVKSAVVDENYTSGFGNYNGTDVTRTKIEDSTSSTGYSLQISTPSTSSEIGGAVSYYTAKSNSRYLFKVVAKVPSGYTLYSVSNMAAGGNIVRIGADTLTGDWKEFSWLITTSNLYTEEDGCDYIGYLYFYNQAVPSEGFTWWLQSIEIYELEDFDCLTYSFGSSNETLTATWQKKYTPVEFDSQGGTIKANGRWSGSSTTYYYYSGGVNAKATNIVGMDQTSIGSPNTSTATISKTGYTFAGWFTGIGGTGEMLIDANGNLQVVSGYTTATTSGAKWTRKAQDEPITLYAKWDVDLTTWEVVSKESCITNITANSITVSEENPTSWASVKLKIPSLTVGVKYKLSYNCEIIENATKFSIDSYKIKISDGTQYYSDWSSGTITVTDLTNYYYDLRFYTNATSTTVTDGTTYTIRYYNIALTPVG